MLNGNVWTLGKNRCNKAEVDIEERETGYNQRGRWDDHEAYVELEFYLRLEALEVSNKNWRCNLKDAQKPAQNLRKCFL